MTFRVIVICSEAEWSQSTGDLFGSIGKAEIDDRYLCKETKSDWRSEPIWGHGVKADLIIQYANHDVSDSLIRLVVQANRRRRNIHVVAVE